MKKFFTLSVATVLLVLASLGGYANPYTITVDSPGQLKSKINAAVGGAQNYNLITSLTIIGALNASDFAFLQQLSEGPDDGGLGLLAYLDITQVQLPGNILPAFAFARVWVKELLLPNSVVTYEWQCFRNSKIEYIKIGTSTSVLYENIDNNYNYYDYTTFSGSHEMKTYEVAADNPHFTSVDGVIFSKDMKLLVNYPSNKSGSAYTIPDNVEMVGFDAFGNTRNLRSVTFPNSLQTISDYGFSGCQELNNIIWGTGLETIGYSAFMWATGLGELVLPEGLKTIGYSAFFNAQMTKVTGPSTLLSIESESFRGDGLDGNSLLTLDFSKCTLLQTIEETSFYDNFILKNVMLPEGLKVIGEASFQNCYSIEDLIIPNSVTTIMNNAFMMFSELFDHKMKKVTLGEGLQTIKSGAFEGCTKIKIIHSLNPNPPSLANDGFETPLNYLATLYVPIGAKQAYQNATRWRDFTNIVEGDFTDVEQITDNKARVYTTADHIVIEDSAPLQEVCVYSMNGALLSKTKSQGTTLRIPANKGVYVVTVGTISTKVVL